MSTNKWSKKRLQSKRRGHLSHYSKLKNEITMQSYKESWVKHEPSVRPVGIRFLSIALAHQSAGHCLLLSMIVTTVRSPMYTKIDRPCTIDKSPSR